MQEYYKMPEQTAEVLEDGWLKTGDLGYMGEDNFVYTTGRRKNLITLTNGENVSPEGLENELGRSKLVKKILVREKDKIVEAEIFPDCEYAKKEYTENIQGKLRELVDGFNRDILVYKQIYSLIVRETEFEEVPSKKVKKLQSPAVHCKRIRRKQVYTLFSY